MQSTNSTTTAASIAPFINTLTWVEAEDRMIPVTNFDPTIKIDGKAKVIDEVEKPYHILKRKEREV